MAITTRAAVMVEHNNGVVVEEIILDDPQGSEVLVKLFATGICHSQLHQLTWPHQRTPGILGHEGTGVVLKILTLSGSSPIGIQNFPYLELKSNELAKKLFFRFSEPALFV